MNNKEIVKHLRQLASFMELHGENEYKIKGYNNAIYNIERLTDPLEDMDLKELEGVTGIGKSIAATINELVNNEQIKSMEDLISNTPEGVVEMMNIKGLGTKKIRSLWQELGITSIDKLQKALETGKLDSLKGFGGKIQESIKTTLAFYLKSKSKAHFATAEVIYGEIEAFITQKYPDVKISTTGELRRKLEIVNAISILVGYTKPEEISTYITKDGKFSESRESSPYTWRGYCKDSPVPLEIYFCSPENFFSSLLITTGSEFHLTYKTQENINLRQFATGLEVKNEKEAYELAGLPYIAPELREGLFEFKMIEDKSIPSLLKMEDFKGVIHAHSHYSDGSHSLREMAEQCKSLGYEYLGISDHSKAASFYANGMDEDRVQAQHNEIDKINKELSPFRIFKGIEADILPDGTLDYDPEILATFDFVVASIHSVLNMDLKKSMERLLTAISNPFTTILGHLTGRQLLIREGYPVDHKAIIDACAENNVIIEVNAHPNRLDLDWRWIPYALEQNVMLSINPDAHSKKGIEDMYYGVSVARKGGLTASMTLNTKSVRDIEEYLHKRREKALKSLPMK